MAGASGHGSGQTPLDGAREPSQAALTERPPASGVRAYVKLARLHQWGKGAFVLVGPLYGMAAGHEVPWLAVALAFLAFGFASSSCYVVNDIRDCEADRNHPRKRRRPIASGTISIRAAWIYAAALALSAGAALAILSLVSAPAQGLWTALAILVYVANVTCYTFVLKHHVILDVLSLATGFVLRVLGGCAAAGIEPSTWLLNCTLFVSMFLALSKRLGERRTMGSSEAAAGARAVQSIYTDDLLRMSVVVTGVATLVTYASYVQAQADRYTFGFNLLWLTMLPATYGLLRCIVLVERGDYDDPTELATRDLAFQLAGLAFVGMTVAIVLFVPTLGEAP